MTINNRDRDLIGSAIANLEANKAFYSELSGSDNPVISRIMSIPAEKRSSAIYQMLDMDVSHCPAEQREMAADAVEILLRAAEKAATPLDGPNFDDPGQNVF